VRARTAWETAAVGVTAGTGVRLIRDDLVRLAHAGHDSFQFRHEAARRIGHVVPVDNVWWWTTDPATGFFTSFYAPDAPADHDVETCRRVHANEFLEPDFNKFRVLARRSTPAGVLSEATGRSPSRSARYRDVIVPMGYEHELRLALAAGPSCWGGIALLRAPEAPEFSAADARVLAQLADPLTEGLRIGIVLGAVTTDQVTDGPGLVLLDEDTEITTATPAGERWLEEFAAEERIRGVPEAIRAIAACVPELEAAGATASPRARLRTSSGRWLVIHGSRVRNGLDGSVAIIIEEARPSEVAPIIIQAYGLTEREAELVRLIVQGLSTKEIAAKLYRSPYTIQDHLKSVFEKFGVRSRRELVARLFDQHYFPAHGGEDRGPAADGSPPGFVAAI
jgi:DNA-binding CsgD family transcriptional regulator